jgi:polyhydroxyalkanoate synthesis regulator phasin
MQEALRTYLELATGITDASRKKVKKAVKDAVGKGGATAEQIRALTSDLVATNAANRDALAKLVRFEVDRALGVVGLATAEEVAELTARVHELEHQLRAAEQKTDATADSGPGSESPPPVTKSAAKRAAKKAIAADRTAPTKRATKRAAKAQPATATTATATTAADADTTTADLGKAGERTAPAKYATGGAARKTAARRAPARKAQS